MKGIPLENSVIRFQHLVAPVYEIPCSNVWLLLNPLRLTAEFSIVSDTYHLAR